MQVIQRTDVDVLHRGLPVDARLQRHYIRTVKVPSVTSEPVADTQILNEALVMVSELMRGRAESCREILKQ